MCASNAIKHLQRRIASQSSSPAAVIIGMPHWLQAAGQSWMFALELTHSYYSGYTLLCCFPFVCWLSASCPDRSWSPSRGKRPPVVRLGRTHPPVDSEGSRRTRYTAASAVEEEHSNGQVAFGGWSTLSSTITRRQTSRHSQVSLRQLQAVTGDWTEGTGSQWRTEDEASMKRTRLCYEPKKTSSVYK